MQSFVLFACLAAASATTLLRAPSHDSAVIQSHRFGGNFAYRTDEAHAYAAINPIISTVRRPVGVSYAQGAPIVRSTTIQAAPLAVAAAPVAVAAPAVAAVRAAPLGYAAGLGYAGLAHTGLAHAGLGYTGLAHAGLGYAGLAY